MYSDRYYYLNIYKDEDLSSNIDTNKLREFILRLPEPQQDGAFSFKNKEGFPFATLHILNI